MPLPPGPPPQRQGFTSRFTDEEIVALRHAVNTARQVYRDTLPTWQDDGIMQQRILLKIRTLGEILEKLT